MKDFDEERYLREDRLFRLRGVTFRVKSSVYQPLLTNYLDARIGNVEVTNGELLKLTNDLVLGAIDEDGHADWKRIQAAEQEDPVMLAEMIAVVSYIIEVMFERPPESPSGSGSTPDSDGTSSTDRSPQLAEAT